MDDPFIYIIGDTRSYAVGDEDAFLLKVDVEGGNTIPEFDSQVFFAVLAFTTAAYAAFVGFCRKRSCRVN